MKSSEPAAAKPTSKGWSLKAEPEEIEHQVRHYATLKMTESFRGVAALTGAGLLALGLGLGIALDLLSGSEVFYNLGIYVPVLIFVARGHRWAMVTMMILWTIEQGYKVISGMSPGMAIILWLVILPTFYRALQVENARRKMISTTSELSKTKDIHAQGGPFCSHCGRPMDGDSRFCQHCGAKVSTAAR